MSREEWLAFYCSLIYCGYLRWRIRGLELWTHDHELDHVDDDSLLKNVKQMTETDGSAQPQPAQSDTSARVSRS